MHTKPERQSFTWQGLPIEILYYPDWIPVYWEVYGYPLAPLAIRQPDHRPLPITDTGALSHYMRTDNIEEAGGPVAYVQAWLDHEAHDPDWQAGQETARQLSLFSTRHHGCQNMLAQGAVMHAPHRQA